MTFLPGFLARLSLRAAYQLEQAASATAKIDVVARGKVFWRSEEPVGVRCVENQLPLEMLLAGKHKRDWFVMGVKQQEKCVVADWFTFKTKNIDCIATEKHADTANEWRSPFFVAHLAAARIEPHHIANLGAAYPAALKKFRPAKDGMRVAKRKQLSRKLQKPILLFAARPIEPADLVILAISIVVAVLRSSPLISATQHRNPLGKKKCGQKIPALPLAQRVDLRIFRWTFGPAIPRQIVIVAIFVAVTVRLIVLFVVADQVVQRETIVRRDEINTGVRSSAIVLV